MQDETARVEDVLMDDESKDGLVKCFVQASGTSFEGILDPYVLCPWIFARSADVPVDC